MTSFRSPALRSLLFTTMLCIPLLGSLGCGDGQDESPSTDASSTAPAGQASPSKPAPLKPAPVGDATVTKKGVPDDFPADFPILPGSTPTGAISLGKGPMIASFTSDKGVNDVVKFYSDTLAKAGWSVETSDASNGTVQASMGSRSASVRVNATATGTNIAIVLEGS